MRLRICDGDGERIVPASVAAVERIFAPGAAIRAGTEISVTGEGVSLVAVALGTRETDAEAEAGQFRLLSVDREHAFLAGPLSRNEALRQLRQFVLTASPETTGENERVSP
jgi:1-deoxy-D-xylulose 5-phosphate reductoisomerase